MPRQKKPEPVVDESKRWLDSYADAITLLMAFFVMLFAFSLVDQQKFEEFRRGTAETLGMADPIAEGGAGILETGNGVADLVMAPPAITEQGNAGDSSGATAPDGSPINDPLSGVSEITTEEQAEALQEQIEERIAAVNADEFVDVTRDERGIVITFDEVVLFASGSARINTAGQLVLATLAQALRPFGNQIEVEGHTDPLPTTGTEWPTNWELGAGRAVNVTRFFVEMAGIPGPQLRAVTYGEYRPVASNDSAEGRSENRRVEVVVVVEDAVPEPPDLTDGLLDLRPPHSPQFSEHAAGRDPAEADEPEG